MQKCKVIAVANQKGGVGKTATTEHSGILTINAIVAADEILIPVLLQYLPSIGMTQLVRTIEKLRRIRR